MSLWFITIVIYGFLYVVYQYIFPFLLENLAVCDMQITVHMT